MSAQVGGKLSQLGGRLIDATAKQMSGLFFKRFAEEIAAQCGDTARADVKRGADSISAHTSAVLNASRTAPMPMDVAPGVFRHVKSIAIVLLLAAIGAGWYLLGGAVPSLSPDNGIHVSADFAGGVLLIVVAAIGYLFGRQQSLAHNGTLRVDRDVIDQLAEAWSVRRK